MFSNQKCQIDFLERENLLLTLKNEKLKATQDYIAMMADIDIPTEEDDDEQEI